MLAHHGAYKSIIPIAPFSLSIQLPMQTTFLLLFISQEFDLKFRNKNPSAMESIIQFSVCRKIYHFVCALVPGLLSWTSEVPLITR